MAEEMLVAGNGSERMRKDRDLEAKEKRRRPLKLKKIKRREG